MENLYKFNFKTAEVHVYYETKAAHTIDLLELQEQLKQIDQNISKYVSNVWDGLVIEFWDPKRLDIPVTRKEADGTTSLGIKNNSGLTWQSKKLMHINTDYCQTATDMANILSHEMGHLIAYVSDSDYNSELHLLWERIRGKYITLDTSIPELLAEDYRIFFGSNGAKNFERTDKYNYLQGTKVRGLLSFYTIWQKAQNYINSLKDKNIISDVNIVYSNADFNYCAITFNFINKFARNINVPLTQGVKIDPSGIRFKQNFLFFSYYVTIMKY